MFVLLYLNPSLVLLLHLWRSVPAGERIAFHDLHHRQRPHHEVQTSRRHHQHRPSSWWRSQVSIPRVFATLMSPQWLRTWNYLIDALMLAFYLHFLTLCMLSVYIYSLSHVMIINCIGLFLCDLGLSLVISCIGRFLIWSRPTSHCEIWCWFEYSTGPRTCRLRQ